VEEQVPVLATHAAIQRLASLQRTPSATPATRTVVHRAVSSQATALYAVRALVPVIHKKYAVGLQPLVQPIPQLQMVSFHFRFLESLTNKHRNVMR
jgi:hypothetical protein